MKLPEIEMVPLSKLKDNPWRDKKRNPINPEKVEQLKESIVSTGEFWIGVYGRKVAGGFVELAFGHHRADAAKAVDTGDVLEAAKNAGLKAIPVAIREFTDGEMLMRMTRENLRGDLPVVLEAVSAAVRALAEGKIGVPEPDPKTNASVIRYAPSFVPGKEPCGTTVVPHPYTADTLAKYLGGIYTKKDNERGRTRASDSVTAALGILELEERRIPGFSWENFKGQPIRKIIPACQELKKRYTEVVARSQKTAKQLAEERLAWAKAKEEQERIEKEERKAALKAQRAEAEAKRDKENKEKEEAARIASKERDRLEEERKENAKEVKTYAKRVDITAKQLAEQKKKAAYANTEQMVSCVVSELNRIAEPGGNLADHLKSLKNYKEDAEVNLRDRQKVWEALDNAATRLDRLKMYIESFNFKGRKV